MLLFRVRDLSVIFGFGPRTIATWIVNGEFGETWNVHGQWLVPLVGVQAWLDRHRLSPGTSKPNEIPSRYVSPAQAAAVCNCHPLTVRRRLRAGFFGPLSEILEISGDFRIPVCAVNSREIQQEPIGVRARSRGEAGRFLAKNALSNTRS